ncbi:MAG: hypothetical protein RIQ53_1988 [Pseudomonadota bacterium]|jgi:hypothetical protein
MNTHPAIVSTSSLRLAALAVGLLAGTAQAAPLLQSFTENFEGTLSAWTQRSPDEAAIMVDPLNAANHVLGFNRLGSSGSIFSTADLNGSNVYTVQFDYLGLPRQGSVVGDIGGYFGVRNGTPGNREYWVAGTGSYPTLFDLIDDGQWHTYVATLRSTLVGGTVHLEFEDWDGSRGLAGDAYFDNIVFTAGGTLAQGVNGTVTVLSTPVVNAVPEPGALALTALGLCAAGFAGQRRRRAG